MKRYFTFAAVLVCSLAVLISTGCQKTNDDSVELQNLKNNIKRLEGRIDSLSAALLNTNATVGDLSSNIATIKSRLDSISNQIGIITAQLGSNPDYSSIKAKLDELQAQYAVLQAEISQLLQSVNSCCYLGSLRDGLIAYYPFDGDAGDSSGYNRHGAIIGASFSIDRLGRTYSALNTNSGVPSYVRTSEVLPSVANTFTIAVWVKPEADDVVVTESAASSGGTGRQAVIHPSHGWNWGLTPQANAGVGLFVGKNQISVTEHTDGFITSPLVYNANISGWHHVILMYDNHLPTLYLDGVNVRTGLVTSIQNVRPSNGSENIQYSTSGFGRSFSPDASELGQFLGSIDDIRIYKRLLTPTEINYLVNH